MEAPLAGSCSTLQHFGSCNMYFNTWSTQTSGEMQQALLCTVVPGQNPAWTRCRLLCDISWGRFFSLSTCSENLILALSGGSSRKTKTTCDIPSRSFGLCTSVSSCRPCLLLDNLDENPDGLKSAVVGMSRRKRIWIEPRVAHEEELGSTQNLLFYLRASLSICVHYNALASLLGVWRNWDFLLVG